MKKSLRDQLQHDEISESLYRSFDYISDHRKSLLQSLAVIVGLAVAIAIFLSFRAHRQSQAETHLSRALSSWASPSAPGATGGAAATEQELKMAAGFGATPAGRQARLILAARGTPDAQTATLFRRMAAGKKTIFSAVAELDAIKTLAAQGGFDQAIARVRTDIQTGSSTLPKDALMFELGRLYEENNDMADARSIYQQLISGYPDSVYTREAQNRLGAL